MNRDYEKPQITQYTPGISEQSLAVHSSDIQDSIDGVTIDTLIKEYGSPLFVYSQQQIKSTYEQLHTAFVQHYPKFQLAWSYKTNYLQAICQYFHKLGAWAEVVSDMEYSMAEKLSVPGEHIIFNGPFKPYSVLKKAVLNGSQINIDNLDELQTLEQIAEELNIPVRAGLRVNMSVFETDNWHKFGFNLESGEVYEIIKRILAKKKITIVGLHSHIGTFVYDVIYYQRQVKQLIELVHILKREYKLNIEYLNLGGGFASANNLKGVYHRTAEMLPSFEQYAEAICQPLCKAFPSQQRPLLLLETGRALIDPAGHLISQVVASKRIEQGKRALFLDAGINCLFTANWYNHTVLPTKKNTTSKEEQVIYGPLCMQIDMLRQGVSLPQLNKGDSVVIKNVGAYNNTQWLQFIHLRPAVVMVHQKKVHLIRAKESLEYLQQLEQVPQF